MKKGLKTLLFSAIISVGITTSAFAADYSVTEDMHNINKVSFSSNATLASFTGYTSSVDGTASVDLKNLNKSSGEIKVHLDTLDTGIKKRNGHLQGLLNTQANPFAVFKLKSLKTTMKTLPDYKAVNVSVSGEMTINKVTKPVSAVLELTNMPEKDKTYRTGDWIRLVTSFDIKLSDYNIVAPSIIPLKVADIVKINVDVMGMKK